VATKPTTLMTANEAASVPGRNRFERGRREGTRNNNRRWTSRLRSIGQPLWTKAYDGVKGAVSEAGAFWGTRQMTGSGRSK